MFATFAALSATCFLTFVYAAVLNKVLKLNIDDPKPEIKNQLKHESR